MEKGGRKEKLISRPSIGGVAGGEEQLHAVVEVVVETLFNRVDSGALVGILMADVFFLGAHFMGKGALHFDQ